MEHTIVVDLHMYILIRIFILIGIILQGLKSLKTGLMIAFKPLSSVQWGFLRQGFLITKNRIPTCCITIKEIHVAYIAILH